MAVFDISKEEVLRIRASDIDDRKKVDLLVDMMYRTLEKLEYVLANIDEDNCTEAFSKKIGGK